MGNTGFMRWENPDATTDLICLCCFRTLACSRDQDELIAAEDDHVCNPFADLSFLHSEAFKGLHRQEETNMQTKDFHAD
jgi:hypothetical protein